MPVVVNQQCRKVQVCTWFLFNIRQLDRATIDTDIRQHRNKHVTFRNNFFVRPTVCGRALTWLKPSPAPSLTPTDATPICHVTSGRIPAAKRLSSNCQQNVAQTYPNYQKQ